VALIISIAVKIIFRLLYLIIPGWAKTMETSYVDDTWLFPLLVFFGQMLEYPPLLMSIMLSMRSSMKPDDNSLRLIDEGQAKRSSWRTEEMSEGHDSDRDSDDK